LYVRDRDKNEILAALGDEAQPGSQVHEQQKMAITVRCTEDIEKAIAGLSATLKENADSNDKLSRKVFWLNVILTIATVAASIISGIALSHK
jgi:Mg2+/citrate symporter